MKQWTAENKTVLLISCFALLVRIAYLIELSYQPDFLLPMVDEKFHWLWAADILNNSFWGESSYFRAPLYGYFLAFLYWVSSGSIFISKFLQLFLCFWTTFFIVKTTESLFKKPTSVIAGLIYAFYGTLIFYESMFLIPALFLFFLTWGLYRIILYADKDNLKCWLITGIIFGLAAISRPNILLVIPFFMLWLFFTLNRTKQILQRIKIPLALCAGLLIVITPITIRNALVTGEFILISSQGGINLYLGNNQNADGLTMLMPDVDLDESVSWSEFENVTHKAAEKETGIKLSETEASSFWSQKAVAFILQNPEKFLNLVWKKSVYLVSGFENSDNGDIYYHRNKSVIFSALLWHKLIYFPFGLLLHLAIVGFYLSRKKRNKLLPLYIYLLAYIPSIVLFLVTARHRLPLVPVLIIFASVGIYYLYKEFNNFKTKEYIISLVLLVLSIFLFNQRYYDQKEIGGVNAQFQIFFNEGIQFEKLGDLPKALDAYRKADNSFPNSATLLNNLAYVQFRLAQYEQAESNFKRALKLDNSFAATYNNYGLLKQKTEEFDSALQLFSKSLALYKNKTDKNDNISMVYSNIADLYDQKQEMDSAGKYYIYALSQKEIYLTAVPRAASFFAHAKMFTKSDSLFQSADSQNILSASHLFNWGLSYMKRNQIEDGISKLKKCVTLDSRFFQAYHLIGYGLYKTAAPKDSTLYYLNKALEINPNFKQALDLKNEVIKK